MQVSESGVDAQDGWMGIGRRLQKDDSKDAFPSLLSALRLRKGWRVVSSSNPFGRLRTKEVPAARDHNHRIFS